MDGAIEIMGALALGVLLGWIFVYFLKFVEHESEILIYTLGFIVLTAGISIVLNFSVLLANMALSATVVNINSTDQRVFKVIRNLDPPFYLFFFVLAGASLELDLLTTLGLMSGVYMVGRLGGKIIGTWLSSFVLGFSQEYGFFLGIGLAPQAGAALGMAMIVESSFPEAGSYVLSTIVATTVIYEIFGPILTRLSIYKSGEMPEEG
jgi:NhaP-type Na+/H+ or K+/H+ antiporter